MWREGGKKQGMDLQLQVDWPVAVGLCSKLVLETCA